MQEILCCFQLDCSIHIAQNLIKQEISNERFVGVNNRVIEVHRLNFYIVGYCNFSSDISQVDSFVANCPVVLKRPQSKRFKIQQTFRHKKKGIWKFMLQNKLTSHLGEFHSIVQKPLFLTSFLYSLFFPDVWWFERAIDPFTLIYTSVDCCKDIFERKFFLAHFFVLSHNYTQMWLMNYLSSCIQYWLQSW